MQVWPHHWKCVRIHTVLWVRVAGFPHHLALTAGWLFLGSHTGDSQLLTAPRQLAEELAAGMPISDAALQWQV
jgi:hypothetical protein